MSKVRRAVARLPRASGSQVLTNKSMLVVTAGIPRSGSTWLYNVVRLLLASKFEMTYACWIDDVDRIKLEEAQASVVKLHEPSEEFSKRATFVLTTHRDLRDIAVSLRALEGPSIDDCHMIASAAHARVLHEYWSPKARLDLAYADIVGDARRQVARIARRLGLDLDYAGSEAISEAVDALKAPTGRVDRHEPTSLLHINHRNDGRPGRWRGELDAETALSITKANSDWLRRFGYEPRPAGRRIAVAE